jgi:drug/metabolite transporter (DMT)-like permease
MRVKSAKSSVAMVASAILAASSNLLLRDVMGGLGGGASSDPVGFMVSLIGAPLILVGVIGYGASQLLWLKVLASAQLGATFPVFVSLTFVIVMAGSVVVLGESLTSARVIGAGLIVLGIIVAESRSSSASGAGSGRDT